MTLTEEQREAIRASVCALEMANRCPRCHKYLKDNFIEHIAVIRDIINSSDQIGEATKLIPGFDLKKMRAVEKTMSPLPWIVLEDAHGEMIIIRNPNHPMHIDGLAAWDRKDEANTPDAIGITYMRENFSNLIDEIERLRAENAWLKSDREFQFEEQAARIKELEAELTEMHNSSLEVAGFLTEKKNMEKEIKKLNERIAELENDLDWEKLDNTATQANMMNNIVIYTGPDAIPTCDHEWQAALEERGYQTCLKYGECLDIKDIPPIRPDAEAAHKECQECSDEFCDEDECPKPRVWQITKARIDAIDQGLRFLEWSYAKNSALDTKEQIAVLRAMLTETGKNETC